MSVSKFRRLLWALNEFRQASPRGITVNELSAKWARSSMNEDKEQSIPTRTFYRIRNAVQSTFDIDVECIKGAEPRYRIANKDLDPGNNSLLSLFFNKSEEDDVKKSNSIRDIIGLLMLGKDPSPNDMQMIKQINQTLYKIPDEYASNLLKSVRGGKIKGADCGNWDEDYRRYVCVWNKETYENTGFWISVGFYNGSISFYLVTNSQNKQYHEKISKILEVEKGEQYRQDYWWFEPVDKTLFQYDFQTFPKMEEVNRRIELLLSKIALAYQLIQKIETKG